jgi:flagellar hook protein FlgE
MLSHAQALNTIGVNIANITTGGYRKVETQFSTVLSETIQNESDLGGVRPRDTNRIDGQGQAILSDSDLHLAISGRGFFILKTPAGKTVYGRDGAFEQGKSGATAAIAGLPLSDGTATTLNINQGFLVDKIGFFVQGIAADATGGLPITLEFGHHPHRRSRAGRPTSFILRRRPEYGPKSRLLG